MAIITEETLKAAVKAYVDATKQLQSPFKATVNDFTKCVEKIGKMVTLKMPGKDKLMELDGDELPYGKTIEEYFIDDFLPVADTYEDQKVRKNQPRPTFEQAVYSYSLTPQKFGKFVSAPQLESVSINPGSYAELVAGTEVTISSSANRWKYAAKRQLLGNLAVKAIGATNKATLVTELTTAPTAWDDKAGENFLLQVKSLIEIAQDENDNNLAGLYAVEAPSLVLYTAQGIMPTLDVKTLSGAFHTDKLSYDAKAKVIKDFGDTGNNKILAVLVDPRGVKLHKDHDFTMSDVDSDQGGVNVVRHVQDTGFLSKYGFVHVWVLKNS